MAKHKKPPAWKILDRFQITLLVGFILFSSMTPRLSQMLTPCLSSISAKISEYQDCTLILALDRYVLISFLGILAANAILLLHKKHKIKSLIIMNILFGIITIVGYYHFLPEAWSSVSGSEVYLDSLYEPK